MNLYGEITKAFDSDCCPNIDFLIEDENEAISGYEKEIAKTDDPRLIALFKHIIEEEKEHIEELENAKSGKFMTSDSNEQKMYIKAIIALANKIEKLTNEIELLNSSSDKVKNDRTKKDFIAGVKGKSNECRELCNSIIKEASNLSNTYK